MNRPVIRFNEDPIVVVFDGGNGVEGSEVDGKFGTEWLHFVNDDSAVTYLDEKAMKALKACGAQRGSTVEIAKKKDGRYNKWEMRVLPKAARNSRPDSALPAKPPSNAYHEPASSPAPKDVQEAATRAANLPESPTHSYPLADAITPFLRAAAIAAHNIEREATAQGMNVQFTSRDIAALASTLFIQYRKEGK